MDDSSLFLHDFVSCCMIDLKYLKYENTKINNMKYNMILLFFLAMSVTKPT